MRTKRRCDKVNFNVPEDLLEDFGKNYASLKYLRYVLDASEGVEQINSLKKIECYLLQNDLTENELQLIVDALCIIFYQAPSKSSHKKALNRIIEEISKKYPLVIETSLQNTVKTITELTFLNTVEEIEKSVLHIICLIDDLTLGKKVVDKSFHHIWKYSSSLLKIITEYLKKENSLQKTNDYNNVCQNILKLITHSIQNCDILKNCLKSSTDKEFQASSEDMKICIDYLLTSAETKLNCRLNAAFVYCNYYYYSFGDKKLKNILFENPSKFPLSSKLCNFSSIMAVLPPEDFVKSTDGYMLADKILHAIFEISENADSSELLLLCGRNILQWTNVIQNILSKDTLLDKNITSSIMYMFSEDKSFLKRLFDYVLHNRNHFIDSLRHLSKDIFRNILNLHILSSKVEASKSIWLKEMTIYLLKDLPSHNRGKYRMLSCIIEKIGTQTALDWDPSLPTELYKVLEEHSLVSHVSELYQVLFSHTLNTEDDKSFQSIWLMPLLEVLCKGSKEQTISITEYILPKLLDVNPTSLTFLLSELSSMWENNIGNGFNALVICLKLYQKQKGALSYLEFLSSDSLIKAFFHADDQVRISAFSLLCESIKTTEPIDSNTFEIIKYGLPYNMNSQSPPFRQQLTSYMKKLFTRMFDSGYAVMKKQLYNQGEFKNISHKVILPSVYQEFLLWIKNYLFSCLHPGANFPRRVTSLNLLHILHEIFLQSMPIVDSDVALHTLLYAFRDTYDNNRCLALKLLSSEFSVRWNKEDETLFNSALTLACSTKPPDTATAAYLYTYIVQCPKNFQLIVKRHLSLLASQDSTLKLTVPEVSELNYNFHLSTIAVLMYELNKQLQFAKKSILEAAACAPLYGVLTCIRSILNDVKVFSEHCIIQWQHLIKELITLSFNVAFVVEPIVCNSSPEGHLPMDTNNESIAQLQAAVRRALSSRFQSAIVQEEPPVETNSLVLDIVKTHAVTAQILLLCCWRTHKEVSLLLGDMSEKLPFFDPESLSCNGVLCVNQMKDIGQYFLYQMSLVKHKGAFEQAHIGFSKICIRLWRSDISKLHELPKIWLNDMILAMKGLKEDIKLCPTRRSAGLPFIIQAIMAAEPCFSSSIFFKKSMSTFLSLAQSSETHSSDVQVHALNVLRTLYRDACLGEAVMPFVSEGLKISIEGFKSSFWAVRNSSTLLFSALMTRVFGVNRSHDEAGKKNRLTGKYFYSYYKDLYFFLIDEIKQCVNSLIGDKDTIISIQPSLYPILLLLARLYLAPGEEDTLLSAFIPYLKICACSPIWKTRKLAAKALVAFIPHEKVLFNLESLIKGLDTTKPISQNEVHGRLLQILYLMEEIGLISHFEKTSLGIVLESTFKNSFDFYLRENKCASTKAAFLQVYLYAMTLNVEPDVSIIRNWLFNEMISPCTDPDKDNYLAVGVAILFLKELQLYDKDLSKIDSDIQIDYLEMDFILYCMNSPHPVIKYTVIEVLLWLLEDDSEEYKYCSEISDDAVVVQNVLKIITLLDKRKYDVKHFIDDTCVEYLVEMLENETDPSLLRQIYKLLSFIPVSLSIQWKFLGTAHTYDLIEKLEYILNSIEKHYFREDITCELLVYSSYLLSKLCEDYESYNKEKFIFQQSDLNVIKKWLGKVEECAYPDNSILLRKTVVSVLRVLTDKSLFPKSNLLGSLNLWQTLLLVLIDDDPEIKYRASEIVMNMKSAQNQRNHVFSTVPLKAVDLMVGFFIENNYEDPRNCISTLINWMMSSDSVSFESMTDEQPFDKGELNVFSEDLTVTNIVSNHLSSFLSHQKSPEDNIILSKTVSCWNDKGDLTLAEAIVLCLSEANSMIGSYLTRAAVSPILDAYFDQELIRVSQRLVVVRALLPCSEILPDFSVLGHELLKKFKNLNFRTFFIEDIISKVQGILDRL